MKIRKARLRDARRISRLMCDTIRLVNSKNYSQNQIKVWVNSNTTTKIKESINNSNKLIFVATDNGKIAGVASLNLKEMELGSLYIKHNIHKKGIGTRLLEYIERYAKNNGFKKLKLGSTITALEFYKNNGYKTIRKNHYIILQGVKIQCILMSKRLI
ncbi:GNAT family N-acetyltransferase [Candidatus Woesearchaeota archaeon]|nr:GNAT family N-acetyltransferase [Candidatus Woesearchaeota archaeon]